MFLAKKIEISARTMQSQIIQVMASNEILIKYRLLPFSDAVRADTPPSNVKQFMVKQAIFLGEMVTNEMKVIADPNIFAAFQRDILNLICKLNSGSY